MERDGNKGNGLNEFDQKLLDEELKMQLEQVQNPEVRRLAMLLIYIGMRRGEYVCLLKNYMRRWQDEE